MRGYHRVAAAGKKIACVAGIDYPARRELDKALVRQLATCRWGECPTHC